MCCIRKNRTGYGQNIYLKNEQNFKCMKRIGKTKTIPFDQKRTNELLYALCDVITLVLDCRFCLN